MHTQGVESEEREIIAKIKLCAGGRHLVSSSPADPSGQAGIGLARSADNTALEFTTQAHARLVRQEVDPKTLFRTFAAARETASIIAARFEDTAPPPGWRMQTHWVMLTTLRPCIGPGGGCNSALSLEKCEI